MVRLPLCLSAIFVSVCRHQSAFRRGFERGPRINLNERLLDGFDFEQVPRCADDANLSPALDPCARA